jgi:hypothetical protein
MAKYFLVARKDAAMDGEASRFNPHWHQSCQSLGVFRDYRQISLHIA